MRAIHLMEMLNRLRRWSGAPCARNRVTTFVCQPNHLPDKDQKPNRWRWSFGAAWLKDGLRRRRRTILHCAKAERQLQARNEKA
jgi:hypothetical protein